MIKRLVIKNFQSHTATEMDFHPGVNVVIGQSDSGKTAVMRAIDWVLNNRPQGDDFRRIGEEETSVEVELDNCWLKRWKRKTVENGYALNVFGDKKSTPLEFRAFSSDVPEEIRKAVNVCDLNFQRQLDAPFLLSKTPGEVARTLNSIVKLDVIDSSLSNINSTRLGTGRDLGQESIRRGDLKAKVESYGYLREMAVSIAYLEEQTLTLEKAEAEVRRLIDTVLRTETTECEIIGVDSVLKAEAEVAELVRVSTFNEKQIEVFGEMEKLVSDIGVATKELAGTRSLLKMESELKILSALVPLLEDAEAEAEDLKSIISQMSVYSSSLDNWPKVLAELEEELEKARASLPKVCPTCGRPL